jgi:iron complex transport system permease protein
VPAVTAEPVPVTPGETTSEAVAILVEIPSMARAETSSVSVSVRPMRIRAQRRGTIAFAIVLILLLAVTLLSAGHGAVALSPGQVLAAVCKPFGIPTPYEVSDQQQLVFWAIRLPRIVFAGLVGAALATAGAGLQGVFRNPLADPTLIGVSSGAQLAAAVVFVFGARWVQDNSMLQALVLPVAAFLGALASTALVLRLSRVGRKTSVATMLLCGIAIMALGNAGTGVMTYLATDRELRSITFWSLGSLGIATWPVVAATAPLLLATVVVMPRFARTLNLFLLGEVEARHLGARVDMVKRAVVVLAALGVGASVAFAGVIGFVGLVVPHVLRLALGPDNRYVVGLSSLSGAVLLITADLVARTLVAPAELPIGIVTAAIGAPFFLWLVVRQRGVGTAL